jgi:hypothetical protein
MRSQPAIVILLGLVTAVVAPPWAVAAEPVGRVLRGGAGQCSAVLIAPALALTAGHCVAVRAPWRPMPAAELELELGATTYPVRAVRLAPQSPFAADGTIRDLGHDWAYLELGPPRGPPPPPVSLASAAEVRVSFVTGIRPRKLGYVRRGDAPVRLAHDPDCEIVAIAEDLRMLLFRCGSGPGAGRSGSPLLAELGGRSVVLAVQSGVTTDPRSRLGIAVVPPPPG